MNIKKVWSKEKYTILVLVFALVACIYTISAGNNVNAQCNEHWLNELQRLEDIGVCSFVAPNSGYELSNISYDFFFVVDNDVNKS